MSFPTTQYKVYADNEFIVIEAVGTQSNFRAIKAAFDLRQYPDPTMSGGFTTAALLETMFLPRYSAFAKNENFLDFYGVSLSPTGDYTILENAIWAIINSSTVPNVDATAANQVLQIDEAVFQTNLQASSLPNIRTSNLDIATTNQAILNCLLAGGATQEFVQAVFLGLIPDVSAVAKSGFNPDVDIITAPNYQLIGAGGGSYTVFVASDGNIQVVSSSASDIGTLYFQYLADANSTEYQEGSIAVNGTTNSNGIKAYRIHTAYYVPSNGNTHNLGTITLRQVATPSNIFLVMLPFTNQTNTGVYTVPKGKKALVLSPTCTAGFGSASNYAKVALFVKSNTSNVFRQRQPLLVAFGSPVEGQRNGALVATELTDLAFMATSCSAHNTEITFSLTILIFPA